MCELVTPKMSFLQLLLPKPIGKYCVFFTVSILILLQHNNNNSVNCNHAQDSNLSNGDYVSGILRRSKRQNGIASGCEIPNYGLHARYTILGETTTTYQPGDYAQQFYTLEVSCDRGYNLKPSSEKRTVCIDGQWNPPLTINCIRTCPSLKSTVSTSVKCKYHNILLEDCNNPVEETTAYLTCNPLYEQDNQQTNRIRLCRSGRWNPSISECYPVCGTKRPKGRPTIVNGQNATVGDYPWQAGIYNVRKELICGGSILDRHIILTAAHCLTDHNGNANPTEDYLIAAGKYYRKYDDVKDEYAQYSKVQSIYVPERYTGLLNNFALDIAIILLSDPLTITLGVQPVCIELNEESPFLHISLNSNGTVTGWGYTVEGRELSEVLKELVIPFIPFRKCFEEVPNKFKKFITSDKICGGYLNSETSICGGDSGGALVFQNTFTERYYVKGIVSTSPATEELTCDSNQYSLYTSVKDHVEFIMNILAYNQIQQSIEFTNDDIDTCGSDHFISEMLYQASSTLPQIIPKVAEFTVNASSTFELRCLSKNFITWTFPNNLEEIFTAENFTKYSTRTIKSSNCNTVYESLLTISNVSHLDVGIYYCHENTTSPTDSTKSSTIYIDVNDIDDDQKLPKERNCHTDPRICHPYAVCLTNLNRKYVCECRPGYIGNGTNCQERIAYNGKFLLLNQGKATLQIPYDPFQMHLAKLIHINDFQTAVGLDIDCVLGRVYWSDVGRNVIKSSNYNGSNVTDFITTDVGTPESLSIDWVARNVYWTDSTKDTIEVANIETKLQTTLFNTSLVNPRGIAVHPQRGKIFWTDWDRIHPKIEWANADGTGREIFLEGKNVQLPNSLVIDFDTERLCYADAGTHKIECLDIDTRYKETIAENCTHPFGIAVTSENIYWSDWISKKIQRVDKRTLNRLPSLNVPLSDINKRYELVAVPQRCLDLVNICQNYNTQCPPGHICLPDGNGSRRCLCGYKADSPHYKPTCTLKILPQ